MAWKAVMQDFMKWWREGLKDGDPFVIFPTIALAFYSAFCAILAIVAVFGPGPWMLALFPLGAIAALVFAYRTRSRHD